MAASEHENMMFSKRLCNTPVISLFKIPVHVFWPNLRLRLRFISFFSRFSAWKRSYVVLIKNFIIKKLALFQFFFFDLFQSLVPFRINTHSVETDCSLQKSNNLASPLKNVRICIQMLIIEAYLGPCQISVMELFV